MRTVVISLPSAAKRRELIEREFKHFQIPFQFYDAVDGTKLSDEQLSLVDYSALSRNARYFPQPGAIAVWCTLMNMLEELVNSNQSLMAVFEDDVRLNEGVKAVLDALSSDMNGFDIVKLSWRQRQRRFRKCADLTPCHSLGIIDGYDTGADAFVISKQAAQHLIQSHMKMCWHLDHLLTRYWENGLVVGIVNPPVAYEDQTLDSQISPGNYSRKTRKGTDFRYPRYSIWRRGLANLRAKVRMRRSMSQILAKREKNVQ